MVIAMNPMFRWGRAMRLGDAVTTGVAPESRTFRIDEGAKASVLVVEEQALIFIGIRLLLHDAGVAHQVHYAAEGDAALAILKDHHIDLVLLDLRLARKDGADLTSAFNAAAPCATVVLMTVTDNLDQDGRKFSAGSDVLILHALSRDMLIHRLGRALSGQRVRLLPLEGIFASGATRSKQVETRCLTQRERKILDHIKEGRTSRAIASALGVGTATVACETLSLVRKLRFSNLAVAAALAAVNDSETDDHQMDEGKQ